MHSILSNFNIGVARVNNVRGPSFAILYLDHCRQCICVYIYPKPLKWNSLYDVIAAMILNVSTLSTQSWSEVRGQYFSLLNLLFFYSESRHIIFQRGVCEDSKLVGAQINKRRHNQPSFIPNNDSMEILADVVYYLLLHNSNYVLAAVGLWVQPLRIFDSSMQILWLQEAFDEAIATVVLQMIINNYYAAEYNCKSKWWRTQRKTTLTRILSKDLSQFAAVGWLRRLPPLRYRHGNCPE